MILIVCVDQRNGMLFNNRRQSRDKILTNHILERTKNNKLWITGFSQDLFDIIENKNIIIDNDFIEKINGDDYCFVEDVEVSSFIDKVDKIILYNWNRHYPADKHFNVMLDDWEIVSEEEFSGSSHDKITERIYIRRNK